MIDIPKEEQETHEKILKDSAKSYLKVTAKEDIKANYDKAQNYDIEGQYPDLIVKFPSGEIVIEEIETISTLNKENVEKWRSLASLGHQFNLIVPLSIIEIAKNLVAAIPTVTVQAYEITGEQISWFGPPR